MRKFEIYRDRSFHFHRFTIQQEWMVAPLFDRFYCRRHQQGMPHLDWLLTSGSLTAVAVLMQKFICTASIDPSIQILRAEGRWRPCVKSRFFVILITA